MIEMIINGEFYSSTVEDLENSEMFKIVKNLCVLHQMPTDNLKEHLIKIAWENRYNVPETWN